METTNHCSLATDSNSSLVWTVGVIIRITTWFISWGKMTYIQHYTQQLHLYGLFPNFCTFTMQGDIFVIFLQIHIMTPKPKKMGKLFHPFSSSSRPMAYLGFYLARPIRSFILPEKRTKEWSPASDIINLAFFHEKLEASTWNITLQICKTEGTHYCKPNG